MATKEGEFIKEHVLKNYPELKEEDTLFKEEALAYALQIKAVNKVTDEIESKGFESFISRLLTALKDLLKMIFGKVSVANIKVDTTIDKLADMLLDKSFKYESFSSGSSGTEVGTIDTLAFTSIALRVFIS